MAGKIYITGDSHGDFHKFSVMSFPEQKELDKDDYLIICGDFGGIWAVGWESRLEKSKLDLLENRPYTTLFIDGNHENFDRLNGYPLKEWHGGKIHEIRPSVLHLMRGQVFELAGKKIFTFGGARSHDIDAGILDTEDPDFRTRKHELDRQRALYRIRHLTWWEEELANEEEMEEGRKNLKNAGNKVDYIITHCCSSSTQKQMGGDGLYDADRETDYLDFIKDHIRYEKWYFGHYHMDRNISPKEILLYDQILEAGENVPDSEEDKFYKEYFWGSTYILTPRLEALNPQLKEATCLHVHQTVDGARYLCPCSYRPDKKGGLYIKWALDGSKEQPVWYYFFDSEGKLAARRETDALC